MEIDEKFLDSWRETYASSIITAYGNVVREMKKDVDLIKAITEFRAAAISGYMPNLVSCSRCGKFEDDIRDSKNHIDLVLYFNEMKERAFFAMETNLLKHLIKENKKLIIVMNDHGKKKIKKKDKDYWI